VVLGVLSIPLDLSMVDAQAKGTANVGQFPELERFISEKVPSKGTGYEDLQSYLQAFFGDATGSYVPHRLVEPDAVEDTVVNDLLLNQFRAVYASWVAEKDHIGADGLRTIVRYAPADRAYKGMVFIDTQTSEVQAVAMSFYLRPKEGIETELHGQPAHLVSDLFPSVVIFWRSSADLERVAEEVRTFYRALPMPMEHLLAQATASKKVNIRLLSRMLS
jgi:hypothetical protein